MITCVCGARNDDEAEFCGECSEPLERTEAATGQQDVAVDDVRDDDELAHSTPMARTTASSRPAEGVSQDQPPEVRPGTGRARPRRATEPTLDEKPAPGDLICGECGRGNVPSRKFCRRCGSSLADAVVVPSPTWWQRLLRPPPRPAPVAGARPRLRTWRVPIVPLVLVVLLVVLGTVGWANRTWVRATYEAALDRVVGTEPIEPAALEASSEAPDRTAQMARDGFSNRSWAPAPAGAGAGEYLVARFDEPFRLVSILVTSGASDDPAEFLAEGRPRAVRLTMTAADGSTSTEDITLADEPGAQELHVVTDDVVEVQCTIRSAYAVPAGQRVAVAEVEFHGRR